MVYASERYVFTTCFVMGLVIVDSLVGARQTGQARRKIPLFYPAYTAALLANAFWLQNSWLLVAVFVIAIAEHFFSAAARSLLFFGGIGKLGQRSACNRP